MTLEEQIYLKISRFLAFLTLLLGVFFLTAWYLNPISLPLDWKIPYETSLCLIFSGLGLLSLCYFMPPLLTKLLALPIFVFSLSSAFEKIFQLHFEFHHYFLSLLNVAAQPVSTWIVTICLFISASLLFFWPTEKGRSSHNSAIFLLFSLFLIFAGIFEIAVFFLSRIYEWQHLALAQFYTALSFIFLGSGFAFLGFYSDSILKVRLLRYPVVIAANLLGLTLLVAFVLNAKKMSPLLDNFLLVFVILGGVLSSIAIGALLYLWRFSQGQVRMAKEMQDKAMATQEALRDTQEAARIGTWSLDLASGDLVLDAIAARMSGEKTSTLSKFIEQIHPEDREKFHQKLQEGIERKEIIHFNFRILGSQKKNIVCYLLG